VVYVFPITIGAMRLLTARGMRLADTPRERGFHVYEVYPRGVQDVLKIPRKQVGVKKLVKSLKRLGIKMVS